MNTKKLCAALSALCMANAAFAALSPEVQIIAPPSGENADWGQIHATTVTFRWAWPSGASSALLTVAGNGNEPVVSQVLSDTSVSTFAWNCGTPTEDTVYDVTLAFSNEETMTAQLYLLKGSFAGAELKEIRSSGVAKVEKGDVIAYRASWGDGLAGLATFAHGTAQKALPYSSGYFCMGKVASGQQPATLDFETESASPAFMRELLGESGLVIIFK